MWCAVWCWAFSARQAFADSNLLIFTETSPPYQFQSGNKVEGIATERVRNIIEQAGLHAEFKLFPWARALKNVERSSRALIYSMAKTPAREKQFFWIAPVAQFDLSIVTLASRSDITLDERLDLSGLSASAQRDDIAESWLLEKGLTVEDNLLLCADILCSWRHLKSGRVDFIIEDPNLIKPTAALVGLKQDEIKVAQPIPELSITAYLAANGAMETQLVERLQKAAAELGYQ
ncbi:hypothetical protein BFC17_18695 [Alteromonas lipolytica]|uniref:Solute-binding protein family 3/N-terminal domain-containing protein n=1 Tax=Alteromonas lipolytica TaxID=1856405 RepID=A0A1E8FG35_9ALTE|nr:hypothetical protein BFC17_18695 [Alteromonas lipolytica]